MGPDEPAWPHPARQLCDLGDLGPSLLIWPQGQCCGPEEAATGVEGRTGRNGLCTL